MVVVKWRLIFQIFALFLQSNAQYHQTDYKVKLNIFEVSHYNRSFLKGAIFGLQWYNRTTRVLNGNGTLIKDLGMNLKLSTQLYKFLSNEYRFFPLTFSMNMCKEVPRNLFGTKDLLLNYSNFSVACPLKKGFYYMRNGIIDFSQFPPYMPTGDYRMQVNLVNGQDYVMELNAYASIEENKPQWWK